jgi:hypothetical protein
MAVKRRHVKAIIQFRRGTENEWIEKNPLLREGEPALSIDLDMIKVGDGIHHWSDLPYLTGGEAADYLSLYNLPSINSITLRGNKTGSELGLQEEMDSLEEADIDRIIFGGI